MITIKGNLLSWLIPAVGRFKITKIVQGIFVTKMWYLPSFWLCCDILPTVKLVGNHLSLFTLKCFIFSDGTVTISGVNLSIVYDPSHLIKGLRNNFLTKNITFNGKISKWQDIVDVYETDCHHTEARLLHKLSDQHVIPEKIKKMKVLVFVICFILFYWGQKTVAC